jgi:hypothetical protein
MSDASGYKLRELLPAKIDSLPGVLRSELKQHDPSGALGHVWTHLGSTAADKMADELDVDLFEVLAHGWGVARELREYADPAKHPPGKRAVVYAGKHKFTTAVHPTVEITVEGYPARTLRFTLELVATFKTIALGIENGRIVDAGAGTGEVSAQLKYGNEPLHPAVVSQPVNLSGRVKFKAPGIAIRDAATD